MSWLVPFALPVALYKRTDMLAVNLTSTAN